MASSSAILICIVLDIDWPFTGNMISRQSQELGDVSKLIWYAPPLTVRQKDGSERLDISRPSLWALLEAKGLTLGCGAKPSA